MLLISTVIVGWISLVVKVPEALWQVLGLFLVVAVTGVWRINCLSHKLHDIHLQKLSCVFLFKLLLLLFILYAGWTPQLNENSPHFGYDPQSYYFQSYELAQSGFDLSILPQQRSAFETPPALVAILVALLLLLNPRSHSDLLFRSFASGCVMAKDGEVALWFQPFVRASLSCPELSSRPSGRCRDRGHCENPSRDFL